ncbi:uncharacterized protein SAPINGB_P006352 [Magnusiomyces paraingens]|uniref:Uncharacterized protein n=1 Tax=Magnusiomyces paraingens TaxID=2606893 RepID=A0A5E8C4H9_9ASCO|nr:uncharacterized protein SAPINGB_P006352 [Saprochaete ingens]VVT58724.1 unnamed protein product [Saprochaete ingens]
MTAEDNHLRNEELLEEHIDRFEFSRPDVLASTKLKPTQETSPSQALHYVHMRTAAEGAREFHEIDSQLTTDDRKILATAFLRQAQGEFLGAALGIAGGMAAPLVANQLLRLKYKMAYSLAAGLVTGIPGYVASAAAMQSYNARKFKDNHARSEVWRILGGALPVWGYVYYRATSERSSAILPDPSVLDWNAYPAFPQVLGWCAWGTEGLKKQAEHEKEKMNKWDEIYAEHKAKGLEWKPQDPGAQKPEK